METKLSAWLFVAAAICFSIAWTMKRIRGDDRGGWQIHGFNCMALGLAFEFKSI